MIPFISYIYNSHFINFLIPVYDKNRSIIQMITSEQKQHNWDPIINRIIELMGPSRFHVQEKWLNKSRKFPLSIL